MKPMASPLLSEKDPGATLCGSFRTRLRSRCFALRPKQRLRGGGSRLSHFRLSTLDYFHRSEHLYLWVSESARQAFTQNAKG